MVTCCGWSAGRLPITTRTAVLTAWKHFADHVANNDLPLWFYMVRTMVVQLAPIKTEGAPQLHMTYALWGAVARAPGHR